MSCAGEKVVPPSTLTASVGEPPLCPARAISTTSPEEGKVTVSVATAAAVSTARGPPGERGRATALSGTRHQHHVARGGEAHRLCGDRGAVRELERLAV